MKTSSIPQEYRIWLKNLIKQYRDNNKPISKEIMIERLSSYFNLSPEYCREVVLSLYK